MSTPRPARPSSAAPLRVATLDVGHDALRRPSTAALARSRSYAVAGASAASAASSAAAPAPALARPPSAGSLLTPGPLPSSPPRGVGARHVRSLFEGRTLGVSESILWRHDTPTEQPPEMVWHQGGRF